MSYCHTLYAVYEPKTEVLAGVFLLECDAQKFAKQEKGLKVKPVNSLSWDQWKKVIVEVNHSDT
jgi:hypothetical protein